MSRIKKAIDRGDTETLTSLLRRDPDLSRKHISWGGLLNPCMTEPLHYLSDGPFNRLWDHGKQAEMAEILIAAGAPVRGLPDSGETPLHGAASLGETGVARVLIENGADIEAVAKYPGIPDGTPLDFAVHFGMTEVVDLLVKSGAKILSTRMAAGAGQLERVAGEIGNLDAGSEKLLDVFRCAAVCDRIGVVEHIISEKLDVNADIDGATALHWAAWEAKPRMVRFLLDRGADRSRKDSKHGMTPEGWARHRMKEIGPRWGHEEVIDELASAR